MNHLSEWTRYYDAPQGTYRYKHKGMSIGRRFTKRATKEKARQALKRAVEKASKKVVEKAAEKAAEKGAEKIQAVLRGRKKTPLSTESRQKLKKMLTKSSKLSGDSRKKLNQILNPGRSAKLKVNQYLVEN